MNSDSSLFDPSDSGRLIGYNRLDFEFTGEFENDRPVLEPIFHEGRAPMVMPTPGTVVKGILMDCPETERGCVVVDTGAETMGSLTGTRPPFGLIS